jgi:hypothetical protein
MFGEGVMSTEVIYQDKLITITKNEIIFHNYYFPTMKNKIVKLENLKSVSVEKPTIWNGRWRLHGTGNFKVWFPKDYGRPKRDRIFIATLKTQWVNIGFTVEDGDKVEAFLKSRNLIEKK